MQWRNIMSQSYTLIVENKSSFSGQVIVYQNAPETNVNLSDLFTLAWLSKGIQGSGGQIVNSVEFDWTIDYGFVWSQKGVLQPGVNFTASGSAAVQSIDPPTNNKIGFTKGAANYTFNNQTNGNKGQLEIDTDSTVVQDQASIGVSMSGAGTFAIVARPRFEAWFIPHPVYTVALGSYQQGQVMDIAQLSNTYDLEFPSGVTNIKLTYNADGTWSQTQLIGQR